MQYFEKMKWPEAWRQVALELIEEAWEENYRDRLRAGTDGGDNLRLPSTPPRTPELADDAEMDSGSRGDDEEEDGRASDNDEGSGSSAKSFADDEVRIHLLRIYLLPVLSVVKY